MIKSATRVAFPLPLPQRRRSYANAYCPLCGAEQRTRPLAKVASPEDGLCPGRCTAAWQALGMLRARESASEAFATRKQLQWDAHRTMATPLSELLRERWRAGDWTVTPEGLLGQLWP